ncbi:MAG: response regulator [Bacteroidales bacterium]|nr:response regulator [Bacteroidales bacterium]
MSKLKNWLYNLKIRFKLLVILFIVLVNFLLYYAFSTFMLNTTSVYTSLIDAERLHTQLFETGLASFYSYLSSGDTLEYQHSISNINQANRLASLMVNIDSVVQNTSRQEMREIFWDYYKVPLHHDRSAVNLFSDRTRLFIQMNFEILVETFDIAAQGYRTGDHIVQQLMHYKSNPSPETLTIINSEADVIRQFYNDFSEKINEATDFGMRLQFYSSAFLLILLVLFTIFTINKLSGYLHKQLRSLVSQSQQIAQGNLDIDLRKPSHDEIGQLFEAFNEIVISMKGMITHAKTISNGEYSVKITPRSEKDDLVIALNVMAENLQKNKLKNERETWLSSGLNQLNTGISGELSLEQFSEKTLRFLVAYAKSLGGNFYIREADTFVLQSSLGMNPELNQVNISSVDGIVGEAAGQDQLVHITALNDKKYTTFTSTGTLSPNELIILPLKFSNINLGVIELVTANTFKEEHLDFFRSVKEVISIGLHVSQSRQQLKELLETTQQQAEELAVQQEELRTTNAELEEQTQLLRENEAKLQAQQEELRVTNEELEERTHDLEIQRNEVMRNSVELEKAKSVVEQKAREVEIASKYKSEFLANMSHELRTPLNSLLILSKDLSENRGKNLTNNQIESARIIYSSGNELLNLINDILDLSKIEAGKMIVNPEPISIEDLEADITGLFKPVAEQKKLYLKTEISASPEATFYNDRQKIHQILKNLVSNALKFTSTGGVTINFKYAGEKSEQLCITVTDTGIGIPAEKQAEIFEAFKQVDGSISRNYGGTGLGLSISRELVRLLRGAITVKSEPQAGSSFVVCIPANFDSADEAETPVVSTPQISRIEEVKPEFVAPVVEKYDDDLVFIQDDREELEKGDQVILIIEDDMILAADLQKKCHEAGFKVLVSGSGENGLFLTEKYRPDAIILDIMLPGIDGYKVLEALKENPETRHIPVQMMSSLDPDSSMFRKWAIGYLTKPLKQVDIDAALDKIAVHINKNVKDLLIIEDDEDNSILISKMLGGKDVNLSLTGSGKKALELIGNNNYDCVVLDLGLHDMSGIELVKKINTKYKKKLPPIIVYTARELTKEETKELQRYTKSIIIKGTMSDGRLLDETALFLHRVVDDMSESKKKIIKRLYNKEAVFENKTVLVVDDDMRNVFALTRILEDRHLKVIEAENGIIALDRLAKNPDIDIILMDVMMPEMDGLTAIRRIRAQEKYRNLPIIVLTAKAMKEDRIKAIEAGANDYLAKPVDNEKLLSLMRVWLYNSK